MLILIAENRHEFLKSNALWILPSVRHFNSQSVFDIPLGITHLGDIFSAKEQADESHHCLKHNRATPKSVQSWGKQSQKGGVYH